MKCKCTSRWENWDWPYYSWSRGIQPVEELDEEKETKGSTRNLPARMIDTVNINTK